MAITEEEQTFFNNAINKVFSYDIDDLRYAQKLLTQYSDNVPELLIKLDKLCGCSFSTKAGLENISPPQAVADSISAAVTAAGGTPSDTIALKKKVGDATLTTTNKDLSGAVNELDAKIGSAPLTTTATTIKAAVNELDAEIGSATLTTTATTLKGAVNELDAEIGSATLTTAATTIKAAINELAASSGGGSATYTPVGALGSFYRYSGGSYTLIATGSTDLATHMRELQKCTNWAKSLTTPIAGGYSAIDLHSTIQFSFSNEGPLRTLTEKFGTFTFTSVGSLAEICKWALDH